MASTRKIVGIVGAGVSGLIACKYALESGFKPIVFEASDCIGGVWARTLESTRLQTPSFFYKFSDFPWPTNVTDLYPDHNHVLSYLQSYANHFDLIKHIRLNSRVASVDYLGPAGSEKELVTWEQWGGSGTAFGTSAAKWGIKVEDLVLGLNQVFEVDFLILCIGRFSDLPNWPKFPLGEGPEVFKGKVMHSMEYSDMKDEDAAKLIRHKKVAVVGFQKSAIDIAAECGNANGKNVLQIFYPIQLSLACTLVFREPQWLVPSFSLGGINMAFLYLNRLAEMMVHKPGETSLDSLLATLLSPLRWMRSRFVETYLKWKLPLEKHNILPSHNFEEQISSCKLVLLPKDFFNLVEERRINFRRADRIRFYERGLILGDGNTREEVDLVIFATGYRGEEKLKNVFMSSIFQKILAGTDNSNISLYRDCIHPQIPQAAFLGYSESLSNLYTSEMRTRWLFKFIEGKFSLPSIREMEEDARRWEDYKKMYSGRHYPTTCIGALHIWFNDQLLKDMGHNPRRKKTWIEEILVPYLVDDYQIL